MWYFCDVVSTTLFTVDPEMELIIEGKQNGTLLKSHRTGCALTLPPTKWETIPNDSLWFMLEVLLISLSGQKCHAEAKAQASSDPFLAVRSHSHQVCLEKCKHPIIPALVKSL